MLDDHTLAAYRDYLPSERAARFAISGGGFRRTNPGTVHGEKVAEKELHVAQDVHGGSSEGSSEVISGRSASNSASSFQPSRRQSYPMKHRSTKTYGHEIGLSACFRQWRANSHCRYLHGYALAVRFEFGANELDDRNWVVDFGGLKDLKGWLQDTFDHKLLVAHDDPHLDFLRQVQDRGLAELVIVPAVGCEAFAQLTYDCTELWMHANGLMPRVELISVEVREHGANSAIYMP